MNFDFYISKYLKKNTLKYLKILYFLKKCCFIWTRNYINKIFSKT